MRRFFLSLALALGLTGFFLAESAHAQQAGYTQEEAKIKAPVLPYFVAILSTMIVLVIVCMPSRRAYPQAEE